jgi:hypothetical protein
MKYEIIASGSDGNATIINGEILIDCGVPMKALAPYKDDLKIVLLTHAHGDHFKPSTVAALSKSRPSLRWAACEWMVAKLLYIGVRASQIDVIQPGCAASYDGIAAIMPEKTVHDVPNCCWHIFTKSGDLFYATDTGTLDGIEAIVVFTQGGTTARRISKFRPKVPILAITFTKDTQRKLESYWGVIPIFSDVQNKMTNDDDLASLFAKDYGIKKGALIIISAGYPTGEGSANMMKIVEVK